MTFKKVQFELTGQELAKFINQYATLMEKGERSADDKYSVSVDSNENGVTLKSLSITLTSVGNYGYGVPIPKIGQKV